MDIKINAPKDTSVKVSDIKPLGTFQYEIMHSDRVDFIVMDSNPNMIIVNANDGSVVNRAGGKVTVLNLDTGSIGFLSADTDVYRTTSELTING